MTTKNKISGGAVLWARKTTSSEIFQKKPDKWFKIWFYLVCRVNHKKHSKWDRGQCFITYDEIEKMAKASTSQIERCFRWLKNVGSLDTKKGSRGVHITLLKYDLYQDLDNYTGEQRVISRGYRPQKFVGTKNKNEVNKNEINNNSVDVDKLFSLTDFKEYITLKGYSENTYDLPAIYDQMMNWIEAHPEREVKVWKNFVLNWMKKAKMKDNIPDHEDPRKAWMYE